MRLALANTRSIKVLSAVFTSGALVAGAALLTDRASADVIKSEEHDFRIVTLADNLEHPWGLAFLPDGTMLVTERPGRLNIVREGEAPKPVSGVPEVVESGQGGMLDVVLHPDFESNQLIYLSYSGAGEGGAGTEVVRGRLEGDALTDVEQIFAVEAKSGGGRHFGSRLMFGADGMLYITSGDRGDPDRAQDLKDHAGKVIRVTADGEVPDDNPFKDNADAHPEIYSWGHRNPQGMALQPGTNRIWTVEHGPRGGDELNLVEAGTNFGWPVITYGRSYAGFSIGEGTSKSGMAQPVTYWVPSISPSGLAFYDGEAFPEWEGNLFVGGLSARALIRMELVGERVVHQEQLLVDYDERVRDVRQGPDGLLYLLIDDSEGSLIRLEPVS
ncbi:PQQ-dependent sugar dehydrogenase [Denitrobaculum tricleocarpae]|uniref:PQQ-dependent sugar dehydrogenase n=1 Tax=Denitrobaculum tricleocarpae TaxID=2591009 RepID=A0A545U240_9PROT|nr:PQQ-dependent sugar dehydrogenase [Denitrobaculum tricleocarpae]TQV83504.1 PQQ-dependent sugar dehydrogenase [Denitrobaculum tricleocarpae]